MIGYRRSGFTLFELSMVLIIIGFISGGILVGRDLIRAAENRKLITQMDQYKLAATTFRNKYNALPGDVESSKAASLGFTARAGGVGHGDGNGIIDDCNGDNLISINPSLGCELVLFWSDLSKAQMIENQFTRATDSEPIIANAKEAFDFYPHARATNNMSQMFIAADSNKENWFVIARISSDITLNLSGYGVDFLVSPYNVTGETAFYIDSKLDDGLPETGNIGVGGIPVYDKEWFMGAATNSVIFCEDLATKQYRFSNGSWATTYCYTFFVKFKV